MVLVLAGIIVFLFKPYETLEEERTTNKLKTINTVYVNYTGDPLCAKLYQHKDGDISKITTPIFLAIPEGMPSPDDGSTAYSNNVFNITGYEYKFVKRNLLTGNAEYSDSNRFDVISWKIVPPYKVWSNKTDKDGILLTEVKNQPIAYKFDSDNHAPDLFRKGNYIDCKTE